MEQSKGTRAKKIALAKYLECKPSEITVENYGAYYDDIYKFGDEEYHVMTEDEAMTELRDSLESLLEEAPEVINSPGFPTYVLTNAIDSDSAITDWVRQDIANYAYDIDSQPAYGWKSRFLEEAYALGVIPDSDIIADEDDPNIQTTEQDIDYYIEDFIDATLNRSYDGIYDYLYNVFGNEGEALKLAQEIDPYLMELAVDSIADAVWNEYGPGHELSSYDGETIELEDGYYAFRQ